MKVSKERGILHLDLHGISHLDAGIEVRDFCFRYQDQLPLNIICGNSAQMIKIAKDELLSMLKNWVFIHSDGEECVRGI